MITRLRLAFWVVLALVVGYLAGSGPVADWALDVYHMLSIEWLRARLARGPNGMVPMLIAGFLIGQGVYLLVRRLMSRLDSLRAQKAERLAAWDPSLHLPRRFGLYRFLEHCSNWSAEDPSTRTQSIALFKIHGLGNLNEEQGSLVATNLLQRIATELRSAALPENASPILHWLAEHFPTPIISTGRGSPLPRCPARWSGSTFALAFRELDAVQVVSIVRDLASWMRSELNNLSAKIPLSLSVGIAVGTSNVTPRSLSATAEESLRVAEGSSITVILDPTDLRREPIEQMNDVTTKAISLNRFESEVNVATRAVEIQPKFQEWLKFWGAPLGCFVATLVLLLFTGSGGQIAFTYYPWPDNVSDVQVLDQGGAKSVRLMRTNFASQSISGWTLSDMRVVQGNPADGNLSPCQVQLSVTNNTGHSYYVSSYDFSAFDKNGAEIRIDPTRMFRMEHGLAGQWLSSGETWNGWLYFPRKDAPVSKLVFHPDRYTRIVPAAKD